MLRGVKSKVIIAVSTAALAGLVATAAPAAATPQTARTNLGNTTVTTAPGVATALLGKGVLPLPILPRTGFSLGFNRGLTVSYRFPITALNGVAPDLSAGDILHAGGIDFVSFGGHLAVSDFDISLADGKVYATKANGASARVPVLDLVPSTLKVTQTSKTLVVRVDVTLDPVAANALNAAIPNRGLDKLAGAAFGTAVVTVNK